MIAPTAQELKERISFVTVEVPYDGENLGSIVSTDATVWAKVTPMGGSTQPIEQTKREYIQNYVIWIRYLSSVTCFQQIVWGAKRLIMSQPPEDWENKHQWMLIHADEPVTVTISR